MNSKLCIFVVVFLAITTEVVAEEAREATARTLSIVFLVLCCAVLFITLLILLVLLMGKDKTRKSSMSGGKYEVSTRRHYEYSTSEAYSVYQDPTVTGSIYLPLDKDKRNQDLEGNGYAHLESGAANGTREETHTYETLKNGSSTFQKTEAAYDNPEFVARTRSGSDDSGSVHEYELAEVALNDNKPKESTKKGDTSF